MSKTICVVDDSPTIRIFVEINLLDAGYAVHSFESGTLFFRWLAQASSMPDIILVDIDTPVDGLMIVQAVQEDYGQDVPFVLMSGRNHTKEELQAWSSRGYTYLQKPFVIQRLLSLLQSLVLRSTSRTDNSTNTQKEDAKE